MPRHAAEAMARRQFWLPLDFTADERLARNNHNLTLIGRLRPVVSPATAQRELTALTETWRSRTGLSPGEGHEGHVFVPAGTPGGTTRPDRRAENGLGGRMAARLTTAH